MQRARALRNKVNNEREDGHCYSFAWIELSWIFGDSYVSFQKHILFTMIYRLSKNEQKLSLGSKKKFKISVQGTSNPALLRLQGV